jgi:uncharacterized protein with ParB-like and HNH nuclease domain
MNASEIRFEEFLSQPKTNFLIPVYQRNYDWQNIQCNEFIKDIEILAKKEKDNHFLGSVVYIKGDDITSIEQGLKEYIVIDGQQRITTTMLFLKVIYDLSQDNSVDVTGTKPKKIKINNEILVIKKRSWIECFTQFCNYLYRYDTQLFENFIFDDDFKGRERRIITNQSELCRKPIKLNDNVDIYIESNLSATAILKYMKLIAEKYELEDDDVVFYVE